MEVCDEQSREVAEDNFKQTIQKLSGYFIKIPEIR